MCWIAVISSRLGPVNIVLLWNYIDKARYCRLIRRDMRSRISDQGLDQERLRRWVSLLALCGVLESAVEKGVIDIYYLKGGVAMELRFARAARTTKDFDLGLRGNRAQRIQRLSEVLQLSFDEFTFGLKPEQHEMELADTVFHKL